MSPTDRCDEIIELIDRVLGETTRDPNPIAAQTRSAGEVRPVRARTALRGSAAE